MIRAVTFAHYAAKIMAFVVLASCAARDGANGLPPPDSPGRIFYVSTAGNDDHDGLSASYQQGSKGPFRTLSRAALAVTPGDTVQIRAGTYQEASIWKVSGTEAKPITVTNYPGETAVIDGNYRTVPSGTYGVLMRIDGDWYVVSGLEIAASSWYGLTVKGQHSCISNVTSHDNWSNGITVNGSYGLVEDCKVYSNSMMHALGAGSRWASGIAVCRTPSYCTVRRCAAWNNWGQGINTYETYYATVEDCVAYDNMANFYVSDAQHVLLRRNLSYFTPGNANGQYGDFQIALLIGDETHDPPSRFNTFVNNMLMGGYQVVSIGSGIFEDGLFAYNTVVNATDTYGDPYTVRIGSGVYNNARFMNNIVWQQDSIPLSVNGASGIVFAANNWSSTPSGDVRGSGDVIGDPLLARTGLTGAGQLTPGWFKITSASPAVNKALVLNEVAEDFFKAPRGTSPDIGAHELVK